MSVRILGRTPPCCNKTKCFNDPITSWTQNVIAGSGTFTNSGGALVETATAGGTELQATDMGINVKLARNFVMSFKVKRLSATATDIEIGLTDVVGLGNLFEIAQSGVGNWQFFSQGGSTIDLGVPMSQNEFTFKITKKGNTAFVSVNGGKATQVALIANSIDGLVLHPFFFIEGGAGVSVQARDYCVSYI